MAHGMRWRILILQVGLIGIFSFVAGFLFWANSFSHNQVHDQLAQQQIFFPQADSKGFTAAEFPTLQQYGGQQLLTGEQAQAYANDYIGAHLQGVAGGQTYSQVSAQFIAASADPSTPAATLTKLSAQRQTLFMGETLRGLLLNAYGWWQVGQYALYAAIGMVIAAGAVLVALFFELYSVAIARRTEKATAGSRIGGAVSAH